MEETLFVRALLLGERLETRGLERDDTLATNPFTLRVGRQGTAFLFRYGVAVFARLSAIEEDEVVRSLRARIHEPVETPETDQVQVRVSPRGGGPD
jgi:required for meiotic nuclear division protein 1